MIIPKPGKANYTEAKAYRPISLSSFMPKMMEKLVDRHNRDEIWGLRLLHRYQFAYQPGKSTETAQHHVITCIEEAVENREVTLGAFLDIEGAFDSTSHSIIIEAAKRHGLEDTICRWINFILKNRKIIATLAGETLEGSVARGCPQGGVLSPMLWSLVVYELVGLNENDYNTLRYADNIAILVSGKFPYSVSEFRQESLSMVQQWCKSTQLSINPQKMVVVPFTRKRI
jgi:hypothetical protein